MDECDECLCNCPEGDDCTCVEGDRACDGCFCMDYLSDMENNEED